MLAVKDGGLRVVDLEGRTVQVIGPVEAGAEDGRINNVDVGYGLEILMIKYRVTRHGAEQLAAREGWDKLIGAGTFDRIPQAKKGLK